jgi:hypothetical protein
MGEVLNALERCFLAGDSPGVKLAAGLAIELITGQGLGGRPLAANTKTGISFAVSVTVLSAAMDQVLVNSSKRGFILPRIVLDELSESIYTEAQKLSRKVSGDETAELAMLGRPLAIELWDDDLDQISICLNYLAISRSSDAAESKHNHAWKYVDLKSLKLNEMDSRECLALSEMLTTMGFANPYDMSGEEEGPLSLHSAA